MFTYLTLTLADLRLKDFLNTALRKPVSLAAGRALPTDRLLVTRQKSTVRVPSLSKTIIVFLSISPAGSGQLCASVIISY